MTRVKQPHDPGQVFFVAGKCFPEECRGVKQSTQSSQHFKISRDFGGFWVVRTDLRLNRSPVWSKSMCLAYADSRRLFTHSRRLLQTFRRLSQTFADFPQTLADFCRLFANSHRLSADSRTVANFSQTLVPSIRKL